MASTFSRSDLDPFTEARWRSQLAKQQVDRDIGFSMASSRLEVPSARNFRSRSDGSISPREWTVPSYVTGESSALNDSARLQREMQATAAGSAIGSIQEVQDARDLAQAQIENAEKQARASSGASWLGAAGKVIGTALPFVLCDARVKRDVVPLKSSEIDDELSQLAFIVQWLRDDS